MSSIFVTLTPSPEGSIATARPLSSSTDTSSSVTSVAENRANRYSVGVSGGAFRFGEIVAGSRSLTRRTGGLRRISTLPPINSRPSSEIHGTTLTTRGRFPSAMARTNRSRRAAAFSSRASVFVSQDLGGDPEEIVFPSLGGAGRNASAGEVSAESLLPHPAKTTTALASTPRNLVPFVRSTTVLLSAIAGCASQVSGDRNLQTQWSLNGIDPC